MTHVIDASAILAYLLRETGRDPVRAILPSWPTIAAVNLGEVAHRLTVLKWGRDDVVSLLGELPLTIVDVDAPLAVEAGLIAALARPYGLSFADRICLMLAKRNDMPALTADKRWADAADALGVKVELIR